MQQLVIPLLISLLTLTTTTTLGTSGVLPLGKLTGIKQDIQKTFTDTSSGLIKLSILPTGHRGGIDADLLDGLHAISFALKSDFDAATGDLTKKINEVTGTIGTLDFSPYLKKIEQAADSLKLAGKEAGYYLNATSISTGTLLDTRLSSNVSLLDLAQTFTATKTFSTGLTVSGGTLTLPAGSITSTFIADGTITNADISSVAAIDYSKLNLAASVTGSDLASNISISTSGNIVLTGSGSLTSAGAISAPTTVNTLNGLVFSSGNATLANLTTSSGLLTSTVADGASATAFTLATSTTYSTSGAKVLSVKNNTSELLSLNKDGLLTINGNLVANGTVSGTQLISTVSTGTAPLVVSSTTQVANLNASLLEGNSAATLMSQPQPNLVLNSDFSRRNKWMTFMPEVFADTSGWTLGDEGSAVGAVAGNQLTPTASAGAWNALAGISTWRDVRISGIFQQKGNAVNESFGVGLYDGSANGLRAIMEGNIGRLYIQERVSPGAWTVIASQSGFDSGIQTNNHYYWVELERQGTKVIAKWYQSGASAQAKTSSNLMYTATATTTLPATVGLRAYIRTYFTTAQHLVGGLNSGDGGVYVEGWGPESITINFGGTKGGQSTGFNEATDSGPIGRQWAMRSYIPAASRALDFEWGSGAPGIIRVSPSTKYTASLYYQITGYGGSGDLLDVAIPEYNSTPAFIAGTAADRITASANTAWTRGTYTRTTDSTAKSANYQIGINYDLLNGTAKSATGTVDLMLTQYEQGSVTTPWRNAPADDGPIVWRMTIPRGSISLTAGGGNSELDPGNSSANLFLPWDASLDLQGYLFPAPGAAGYVNSDILLDSTWLGGGYWGLQSSYNNTIRSFHWPRINRTATAGKHRVSLGAWALSVNGSTDTSSSAATNGNQSNLTVIATRGR